MTEQDKIKFNAQKKLVDYVKRQLRFLEDGKLTLQDFDYDIPDGYFTEAERPEIERSIQYVHDHLKCYCRINDIKSSLLTEQNN